MNVGKLALENIERFGEYPFLYHGERSLTNVELDALAGRLAAVLVEAGIEPGDRVLVQMPNAPEVLASFQAAWKIGAVLLPATPQLGAAEVRYLLEDSEARAVLTTPELAPRQAEARRGMSEPPRLLVFGDSSIDEASDVTPAVEAADPVADLAERADDDLALLLYTSGTTGRPKGVRLTHGNVLALPHPHVSEIEPYTRTLHVLPLSHSFGVVMMSLGLIKGMQATLHTRWQTEEVFATIEAFGVQRFAMVPTMLSYMLDFPDHQSYDHSSLECVWTGGAPLPDEVRREFERVFRCEVRDGYGMTESMGAATTYRDGEEFRPGSVGRAMPGMAIRIVDDEGRSLGPHQQGEVLIQGPTVMPGYWRNEAATGQVLRCGWLCSGDVGYLDEDGFLYITDRKKDLIIKGGENISPREIEEVLYEHPAVAEAVVVGVPHARLGEDIWAAVAPKTGGAASEEDLLAHVGERLTKFKVPSGIAFFAELPKNNTGKLQKREVRRRLSEQAQARSA